MDEYYDTKKKKIGDFMWGFTGFFAGNFILYYLLSIIIFYSLQIIQIIVPISGAIFPMISYIIMGMINIFIIFLAFKKGRRYIAIGIINAILIPLLLFGACIGIISIVM